MVIDCPIDPCGIETIVDRRAGEETKVVVQGPKGCPGVREQSIRPRRSRHRCVPPVADEELRGEGRKRRECTRRIEAAHDLACDPDGIGVIARALRHDEAPAGHRVAGPRIGFVE